MTDVLHSCVEQCAERAWRLAYALMRNGHDAEDVVQEAFVVAARRRDRIPHDDPWPWFATVVSNVARNARRARRKHMHDDPPEVAAPGKDNDLSLLVAQALAQLPEAERDAIACTHLSGLTQAQAAEALEIPVGTVATRVRGGLETLRRKLGKSEKEVALGVGIMLFPQPEGGIEVASQRWLLTAQSSASEGLTTTGGNMKTQLAILSLALLALLLIGWLAWPRLTAPPARPGATPLAEATNTAAPSLTSRDDAGRDVIADNRPVTDTGTAGDSGPAEAAPAPEAAVMLKDNVLRVGVGAIDSLDPMLTTSSSTRVCTELVYEGLYEVDPFDYSRIRPLVAAALPAFDADMTSATITLRGDVQFADHLCFPDGKGRPVEAADVAWSLARALRISPYGTGLRALLRGANPMPAETEPFEGIVALDRYTLLVRLAPGAADLERELAGVAFVIVPREGVEAEGGLGAHMAGTGPFVLKSRTETGLVFERNGQYRDVRLHEVPADSPLKPMEGRRLPLADGVHVLLGAAGVDELKTGRLSIVQLSSVQLAPMLQDGRLLLSEPWRAAGLKLFTQVTDGSHIIEFDMRNALIGAPGGERATAMRRALSLAFDRLAWTRDALGHNGYASASMIAPGTLADDAGTLPLPDHEAARRCMQDAGFLLHTDGGDWIATDPDTGVQPALTLTLRSDSAAGVSKGEFLRAAGRQVGIRVEVVIAENWNAFVQLRMNKEGKGQMYDMGWSGGGADPSGRYELYMSGSSFSSFSNAEYDRLVPLLKGLRRPGTHEYRQGAEALPRIVEILETEAPVIVIAYTRALAVGRADLVRPTLPAGLSAHRKYWGFSEGN